RLRHRALRRALARPRRPHAGHTLAEGRAAVSILVTGATGFIGREVVQRLLAARRHVLALARTSDGVPAVERVVAALGDAPPGADLDVLEDDTGQAFHNAYERVKLEAERVIQTASAGWGVDVRVFRPSIVVGAAPATAG